MRLSVVMPSNRSSPAALSRIWQASSWASADIEVIVRDNSGDSAKKGLLKGIHQAGFNAVTAEPCDASTNFRKALALAKGEFVLFLADDDSFFDRGIAAIAAAAERHAGDPSVVGLTGTYALEETSASHVVNYPNLDSADVTQRVDGYLGYQGPNLIFYSAIRRSLALDAFKFIASHPFQFPFHDNLYSLIYLLSGRFIHVGRLTSIYDNGNWDAAGVGAESDLKFYAAAGMDPIIRQLHWLLCGFEGASIALRSRFAAQLPLAQRQAVASKWFELMFRRFAGDVRNDYGSSLAEPASVVREKLLRGFPNFSLETVRDDICTFIALYSPEQARWYERFWKSVSANATVT